MKECANYLFVERKMDKEKPIVPLVVVRRTWAQRRRTRGRQNGQGSGTKTAEGSVAASQYRALQGGQSSGGTQRYPRACMQAPTSGDIVCATSGECCDIADEQQETRF